MAEKPLRTFYLPRGHISGVGTGGGGGGGGGGGTKAPPVIKLGGLLHPIQCSHDISLVRHGTQQLSMTTDYLWRP